MFLTIRISGPAGAGINSLTEIVGIIFSDLGYNVISDVEYESRIKGGTNWFDLNISDSQKRISRYIDVLVALDLNAVTKSLNSMRNNGIIILNTKHLKNFSNDISYILNKKNIKLLTLDIQDKYENTHLLGVLIKLFNIEQNFFEKAIHSVFEGKSYDLIESSISNVQKILNEYKLTISPIFVSKISSTKKFIFGNKMIALGAIDAGLEYYSAYPMTPATSILTEIIKDGRVTCLQPEDEIAVINSSLGASFTGARAMVGTSGGGFALMSEAISFAAQAEFPITIVLSQRAGPSTGTPTYQEQGDLKFALTPSFGEFDHIVVCPSTLEEGYIFSGMSLNLAQKYQTIVILLTDRQFSENFLSVSELPKPITQDRGKLELNPDKDYKRYKITEDGISPYVKVGTLDGDFIATSYEHDEYGTTTENSEMKKLMTIKRSVKLDGFFEKERIFGFEIVNPNAKRIIVTTSFNRYTAEEFVNDNKSFGLLVVKFLLPIDLRIRSYFEGKEEIIFLENNYSGQLQNHITKSLNLSCLEGLKINHFRKFDLLPFYYEDLEDFFLNK